VQVIREVTDNVNSIAGAIEEQSGVTTEVAANITQASAGVQDATVRAAEMASVSKSLSADISGVDGITSEIRAGGENVRGTALELTRLAEHLMAQVGQFKVS
jgi:methyl-accepting chemotaxis protein